MLLKITLVPGSFTVLLLWWFVEPTGLGDRLVLTSCALRVEERHLVVIGWWKHRLQDRLGLLFLTDRLTSTWGFPILVNNPEREKKKTTLKLLNHFYYSYFM